jgi:hypothetical protein
MFRLFYVLTGICVFSGLSAQSPAGAQSQRSPSPFYNPTSHDSDNAPEKFKTKDIYPGDTENISPFLLKKSVSKEERSAEVEKVIKSQLQAISALDFSKAYYAFMSKDFQKTVPDKIFKAYVTKNLTFFGNEAFNVESVDFNDEIAAVKGKLSAKNGQTASVQYDLIQEDGLWKIRKIDIAPEMNNRLQRGR